MSEETVIVLTLYGKEKDISHIAVSLFDSGNSANNYCDNTNEFSLQDGQWVYARIVGENEKIEPIIPKCMDMKFMNEFDDRQLQCLAREIEDDKWACALTDCDDGTKERVLKNMSKRRVEVLQKEMNNMGAVSPSQINGARYEIFKVAKETRGWYF
jgi:hypothetical protein